MFVLLGEILLRSGIAERMYGAMAQWLSWLPGGLMHSNIGACTLFSAVCGSSVATAATIGTVAVGQIERHGYNAPFFLGTIAAGGTLGILIPPSINMIIYGVLTDTSIPQLYLAAFVPGLVLAGLFMLTVLIGCTIRPAWGGRAPAADWPSRWRSLPDLVPPLADLPAGDRLDLRRPCDPDRGGGPRRARGAGARRLVPPAHACHAARTRSRARCAPRP